MGRHGALRRPGRRRTAPEPGRARGRGHLHDAQDPGRPARRHHPREEGVREEAELVRLPGLPGRSPGACDRGEGGVLQGRGLRGLQGAPAPYGGGCPYPRRASDGRGRPRRRGQRALRRYGRASDPGRPARLRAGRPAGRGPAARGRHHGQPQRGPERPASPDGHLGPADRHARARDPRLHGRGLRRGRGRDRRGAEAVLRRRVAEGTGQGTHRRVPHHCPKE